MSHLHLPWRVMEPPRWFYGFLCPKQVSLTFRRLGMSGLSRVQFIILMYSYFTNTCKDNWLDLLAITPFSILHKIHWSDDSLFRRIDASRLTGLESKSMVQIPIWRLQTGIDTAQGVLYSQQLWRWLTSHCWGCQLIKARQSTSDSEVFFLTAVLTPHMDSLFMKWMLQSVPVSSLTGHFVTNDKLVQMNTTSKILQPSPSFNHLISGRSRLSVQK